MSPKLHVFTGRNEVVAKVMFLLVSVILLTPQEDGTLADGTHPTGMHSCFVK